MPDLPLFADLDARERLVTDFGRNLIVEAGAGSGKTHALAARMAAGVAAGVYEIEQMAAVTFTRKAAAELRGRFQLALEEERQRAASTRNGDAEANEDRAGRIDRALRHLEHFFAGTIHAFCARLLRERPVEAGVSPGFTELDDVEDRLLRQQSWRDYRAQAAAQGDPDFLALGEAGLRVRDLDDAFEVICLYDDVEFPPGDAPMPSGADVWEALDAFWATLSARLPPLMPADTTCQTQKAATRFAREWQFASHRARTADRLVPLVRVWEFTPKIVQKYWPGDPATKKRLAVEIPALHQQLRTAVIDPFMAGWRRYLYMLAVTALLSAREVAARERRRRNTLNFNDLLVLTSKVLRENAEVRRALQDKYRWLFVDEFQDTDPVQAEIVFLLSASETSDRKTPASSALNSDRSDAAAVDWRTVPLRPGAIFVVGDPKQSIYRFRRADIDVYNEVRARLGGRDGAGLVRLTSNFRSVPALCTWANHVFDATFPGLATAEAPAFAPLDPIRAPDATTPAVMTLTVPGTVREGDVAREEAKRIAEFIQSEVQAGRRTYGEFLILTRRKRDRLAPYVAALEERQIPLEVSGAGAFGASAEVATLALVLRALSDAQDGVALVGVLRGPLFGLSDRDLFAYRQAGGYFGLFSEIAAVDAGARRVAAALAALRVWHRWVRQLPPGAALDRVLEASGYLALAATTPDGVEAGDLLHAVDRVRAVVEAGFTLLEAAEALDDAGQESSEVESLPLEPGRRDGVRLMNLHKAKGLEAAVVFLADPCGGFEPRVDVRIVRHSTSGGGRARGYFLIADSGPARRPMAEPADWAAHEAAERRYLEAEGDRLLYVAATRACDTVVVGRWASAGGQSVRAWEAFDAALVGATELARVDAEQTPARESDAISVQAAEMASTAAVAAHDRVRQPTWAAAPPASAMMRLPRMTIEVADFDDPSRTIVPDTFSHRADAGLAWGTLMHGLLEHAMRHRSATRDDLRRLALWLTVEEPQLRAAVESALDTVQTVANADFWRTARASSETHEEVPFAVRDLSDDIPKVVSGTIDLVYRGDEGWQIVDYKTDVDAAATDLDARHRRQVEIYERAWGRVADAPVAARVVTARQAPPLAAFAESDPESSAGPTTRWDSPSDR